MEFYNNSMEVNAEEALKNDRGIALQAQVQSIPMTEGSNIASPVFSIVIPTWKRIDTLKDTVSSALTQKTTVSYDVIVVEDNPEPDTEIECYLKSLESPILKYYKNSRNIGLIGNFNKAVSLADGKYAVLIHDDDYLFPEYLENVNRILENHPDIDILCPEAVKWKEYKGEPRPAHHQDDRPARLWRPFSDGEPFNRMFMPTGVTFRKSAFLSSGGFDNQSGPSADLYYIVRAGRNLRYCRYDKPLFVYRWAENESLKYSTRMDFIRAGLPLRRLLLSRNHLPSCISGLILKYYCYKSLKGIEKDFPEKRPDTSWLVLPENRIQAGLGKLITDAYSRMLEIRRLFAPKI